MMDMKDKMMMGDSEDAHHKAKLEVLNELRDMAMNAMGDKMKSHMPDDSDGMAVHVEAQDPESLKEGLQEATKVAPGLAEHMDAMSPSDDMMASGSDEDMSLDEIESMIHELEQKRKDKLAQG